MGEVTKYSAFLPLKKNLCTLVFLIYFLFKKNRYLVYNLRKRGGDSADKYFKSTEMVAGVKDMRFQALMPDILHWLGITKIDNMVSMSDMKYDAIVKSGIPIKKRYDIPGSFSSAFRLTTPLVMVFCLKRGFVLIIYLILRPPYSSGFESRNRCQNSSRVFFQWETDYGSGSR